MGLFPVSSPAIARISCPVSVKSNIQVFRHAFLANAFRNDHYAPLVQPAEDNGRHRLAVFSRNGFQYRVVEDVVLPLGERRPCLVLDALFCEESVGCRLLVERVGLDLVDGRLHLVVQEQVL